jgi:glycosyltransferase involved in cell wall biosynthesis
LDQTVWQYQPHILHVNNAQAMLWSGPAMRFRGPSVVWHLRDFLDFPRVGRLMARHTDAVVAVSKSILTFAADMLGPSARRLVLVRNGIADLPPDHAGQVAAVRRDLGVTPDAPLVVMAGQSVPRKGHAVLLQALARLATARPDLLSWLLCIEHDLEASSHTQRLRRQAAELGCGRGVRITEGVAQISPVLRAANVVVVPSLREPFGRIAVEAMLAERPVIASAVDGLNEIVAAGATGILVPPGNPARLAAALASVLDAPTSWEARGRAARRRALRLFSVSRMADEMVSLYRTVRRG